jgi:nucleoside-diphosphate-sugar epimerase
MVDREQNILVTGGNGFLGKHVVSELIEHRVYEDQIHIPSRPEIDLRNPQDCRKVSENMNLVIHLAAKVGGIGFNKDNPAVLFEDIILMGVHKTLFLIQLNLTDSHSENWIPQRQKRNLDLNQVRVFQMVLLRQ